MIANQDYILLSQEDFEIQAKERKVSKWDWLTVLRMLKVASVKKSLVVIKPVQKSASIVYIIRPQEFSPSRLFPRFQVSHVHFRTWDGKLLVIGKKEFIELVGEYKPTISDKVETPQPRIRRRIEIIKDPIIPTSTEKRKRGRPRKILQAI